MNRQRWSKPRLQVTLLACNFLLRWSEGEKLKGETFKVPLPADLRASLEEARDLLANRLAPPSHDALLLSPRERIALDALLAGECTSVTLASVLTKLRRLP